jgi:tyrosine-protein kinase Etk/Wzc
MEEPRKDPAMVNEETHFLDYLIVIAKHKRMTIYTSIAVTLLCYLALRILPNKYITKATIFPPQQNLTLTGQLLDMMGGSMTPGSGVLGSTEGMAAGLLGLKSGAALYAGMMMGDTISDAIIAKFKLKELHKVKFIEDARKKLKSAATITVNSKSGLITIDVTDKDPQRAADIANAYWDELNKLLQGMVRSEASDRLAFLENERRQTNYNLSKAEETIRDFSEKKGVIQIDAQTRGVIEYIAILRAQVDAKEVGIQVMRQQATPSNYDVIRLETELKGLKEKLRTAETQWNQAGKADLPPKIPTLGLDYLRLYREVRFQEALYQLYSKLVEMARLDQLRTIATGTVQVVDRAQVPQKRSNLRMLPSMAMGILTFLLMTGIVFLKEYLHNLREKEPNRLNALITYFKPSSKSPQRLKKLTWVNKIRNIFRAK